MVTFLTWMFLIGLALGTVVLIANRSKGYRLVCPYCRSHLNVGATVCPRCGRNVPRR